jgi:hypothetical protein
MIVILVAIALVGGFLLGCVVTVLVLFIAAIIYEETNDTRSQQPPYTRHRTLPEDTEAPNATYPEDSRHLSPAGAPSQLLSPKQLPTGNNCQIGEH